MQNPNSTFTSFLLKRNSTSYVYTPTNVVFGVVNGVSGVAAAVTDTVTGVVAAVPEL